MRVVEIPVDIINEILDTSCEGSDDEKVASLCCASINCLLCEWIDMHNIKAKIKEGSE
jgi:hypothetical protein